MGRLFSSLIHLLPTVVGGSLVAALSLLGAFRPFDLPVGDLILRTRPATDPASAPVAAIVIDDASLDALGPLPWGRERIANLIGLAFHDGARALALDLVLAGAEEPSTPTDGDRDLAAALDDRPVVLAAALRPDGGWLLPDAAFGGARRAAHAEGEVGPDGVVRTILATKQRAGVALPALSLAAARLVDPAIPVTPGAALHPDFRLLPVRVPTISALDLIMDRLNESQGAPQAAAADPSILRDRLVFFGTTATAATDQFVVPPGGGPMPGVLIHASAAASLLAPAGAHALLHPLPPAALVAACLALAALAQLARAAAGRLRLLHFAAVGVALVAAGVLALPIAGLQLPLVTLAAAFGASALLREAAESAQAQRDTGRLLRSLVAADAAGLGMGPDLETGSGPERGTPRGATGRLALARELQQHVIRDRDLRRALLDSLEDGVIRWDVAGRVVLANAAAAALWSGRSGPEAPDPQPAGRSPGDRPPAAPPPEAAGRSVPSRDELLAATGASPRRAEEEAPETPTGATGALLRRGGRQLRALVRPLDDGGSLGVLRDVTAERELEDRRREMQRLVSHELKTPLSSIASFGGMLERYELSDEELARIAGLIRGESERLLEMVTTFLDLERIGGGRWTAERTLVDLAALARERCELLAGAAAARGLSLEVTADGPCPVAGDAALLARVVDNLAGNAIKYTPAGGHVRLGVHHLRPGTTEVPSGSAGSIRSPNSTGSGSPAGPAEDVELTVADDGPGIPAEALPRLFDRFYRVPGGARESGASAGGSGLGLALVREIVQWHGGCVSVESETGRGSVFTVRLPALGAPANEGDRS